jgi:hypothetical protein
MGSRIWNLLGKLLPFTSTGLVGLGTWMLSQELRQVSSLSRMQLSLEYYVLPGAAVGCGRASSARTRHPAQTVADGPAAPRS